MNLGEYGFWLVSKMMKTRWWLVIGVVLISLVALAAAHLLALPVLDTVLGTGK